MCAMLQITVLSATSKAENRSWFTATQDTNKSTFKLAPSFAFLASKNEPLSPLTKSLVSFPDLLKVRENNSFG